MHKRKARGKSAETMARIAKGKKSRVEPDNEPGRTLTLVENGCSFEIPLTGPKGRWDWEKISDKMLCAIIEARIAERGITSRNQLQKSKPQGSAIIKNAASRGLLDELIPKGKWLGDSKGKDKPKKRDPEDRERAARIRREVIDWMNDDEWWDNLGKNKE
jgi:hypothetical protein